MFPLPLALKAALHLLKPTSTIHFTFGQLPTLPGPHSASFLPIRVYEGKTLARDERGGHTEGGAQRWHGIMVAGWVKLHRVQRFLSLLTITGENSGELG